MARQPLSIPAHDHIGPVTTNVSAEFGESWRATLVKAEANFVELYDWSQDLADVETDRAAGAAGFPPGYDLIELAGDGVPAVSAQAALTTALAGSNNDIVFTAIEFGDGGNDISVAYEVPDEAESPLSVSVVGKAITVSLETDDSDPPEAISTADEVKAAIEASEAADALVTVIAMTQTFLEGGDGVGVGAAGKGSRYTDVDAGTLYINTGTKDEPEWTQLAPVS
jgi:hypothetical protein